jgi:segregation and condensation protein B
VSLKGKIEAVLFLTDKPIRAQAIAKLTGEDVQLVRQTVLELIHDYEERDSGLEIADEEGYVLRVKDEYSNIMEEFMPLEMTAAVLRTLSAITIKQPISQSEIIRIRGAGAYDHIKDLVHRGLVNKREDEKNRSPIISTTKKFQEYFRLTKDGKSLRQYLKRQMKKKDNDSTPSDEFDASPDAVQLSVLGEGRPAIQPVEVVLENGPEIDASPVSESAMEADQIDVVPPEVSADATV